MWFACACFASCETSEALQSIEAELDRHGRLFSDVDFRKDPALPTVDGTINEVRQALAAAVVTKCEWKVLSVWEKKSSLRDRLKKYTADLASELKVPEWQKVVNQDLRRCIEAELGLGMPHCDDEAAEDAAVDDQGGSAQEKHKKKDKKDKKAKGDKKDKKAKQEAPVQAKKEKSEKKAAKKEKK